MVSCVYGPDGVGMAWKHTEHSIEGIVAEAAELGWT